MKDSEKIVREEGRMCVHQSDLNEMRNFNIDRVHTTIVEAGSIFRQIASFIRFLRNGGIWERDHSFIDDFKAWPQETTDDPRLCIVWNPDTYKIQFSAIGLTMRQAEISAHHGALYMDALSLKPADVWNDYYGVEDGGANDS